MLGFTAILCIALGAGGAAALNQWWEADIDAGMKRTAARPLPSGRMNRTDARDFGVLISAASVMIMGLGVNWLAAAILALSIFYYAVIYTVWLKPRTPQNIVIGGGAGAFPPLIGWVAVTGEISLMPVLLFLIIFMWTPPHFWALALFVKTDYANVGIPMMPVVRGEASTRRQILAYAVLLVPVAAAPWFIGGTSYVYGVASLALTLAFLALSVPVAFRQTGVNDTMKPRSACSLSASSTFLPCSLRLWRIGCWPTRDGSHDPEEETELKRRQKSRNLVLGGVLLFLAVLFYVITIARM